MTGRETERVFAPSARRDGMNKTPMTYNLPHDGKIFYTPVTSLSHTSKHAGELVVQRKPRDSRVVQKKACADDIERKTPSE